MYHAQHLHKKSGTKEVGRLLLLHQLQYYYLCFSAQGRCGRAVTVINYGLEGYFCLIAGLLNLKQVHMSSSLIFRISSFFEILNLRQRQGTAFLAIFLLLIWIFIKKKNILNQVNNLILSRKKNKEN